jgi:hypothetical protein
VPPHPDPPVPPHPDPPVPPHPAAPEPPHPAAPEPPPMPAAGAVPGEPAAGAVPGEPEAPDREEAGIGSEVESAVLAPTGAEPLLSSGAVRRLRDPRGIPGLHSREIRGERFWLHPGTSAVFALRDGRLVSAGSLYRSDGRLCVSWSRPERARS